MPCMGPVMRTEEQIDTITKRLLEVLLKEFGIALTPDFFTWSQREKVGESVGINEEHRRLLRDWVRMASDSDDCNSF